MWVTQPARQLVWELDARGNPLRFLIHDIDRKFTDAFDTLFKSQGLHVIHTPYQTPIAYAYVERWIRTAREECLYLILVLKAAHLQCVLQENIDDDYNVARPHQGIEHRTPMPPGQPLNTGMVQRRKVLCGTINNACCPPGVSTIYLY